MVRLNELINNLCPDGVVFKPLWSILFFDKRFAGVDRAKQTKVTNFKHVSAETLKSLSTGGNVKLLSTGKFDGSTSEDLASNYVNEGEVITIPSGGAANLKYFKGKFVDGGNILCSSIDPKKYDLRYVYHCLLLKKDFIQSCFRGGSVQHPEMPKIIDLRIPMPPFDVQKDIARILDNFTELTAELTAELQERRKQYEYYRDAIFKSISNSSFHRLDEVFQTRNGFTPSKSKHQYWENGTLPWFRLDDIKAHGRVLIDSLQHITQLALKRSGLFEANSIIISTSATIGEYALIKVPFLCNQRFTCLTIKSEFQDKLIPEFFLHYCFKLSKYCRNNLNRGNFASVDMAKFNMFLVPIPTISEQKRIIDLLEKFDKYCNDLQFGLPGEIECRKKQYAYYREKLLTFKELN